MMEEERTPQPRLTAFKVIIRDIANGKFQKVEGQWEPSYLITPIGQKLSRVHIFGLAVNVFTAEDGGYSAITVDDGTSSIRVKAWREEAEMLRGIEAGKLVDVVGKIREYNEEIYISPETVIVIDDPNFGMMRKLEIVKQRRSVRQTRDAVVKASKEIRDEPKLKVLMKEKYGLEGEQVDSILGSKTDVAAEVGLDETDGKSKVLEIVRKAGKEGIDYSEIIRGSQLPTERIDEAIKDLITEGEIFEPKSGRFKLLA